VLCSHYHLVDTIIHSLEPRRDIVCCKAQDTRAILLTLIKLSATIGNEPKCAIEHHGPAEIEIVVGTTII
jgi:hypothetical protein